MSLCPSIHHDSVHKISPKVCCTLDDLRSQQSPRGHVAASVSGRSVTSRCSLSGNRLGSLLCLSFRGSFPSRLDASLGLRPSVFPVCVLWGGSVAFFEFPTHCLSPTEPLRFTFTRSVSFPAAPFRRPRLPLGPVIKAPRLLMPVLLQQSLKKTCLRVCCD